MNHYRLELEFATGRTTAAEIEAALKTNGRDPFTRRPIQGKLYSNKCIRDMVVDFLDSNPWAYEYSEEENYRNIEL